MASAPITESSDAHDIESVETKTNVFRFLSYEIWIADPMLHLTALHEIIVSFK